MWSLLTTRRARLARRFRFDATDLDLAAFFQCALAGDHHALSRRDAVADLDHAFALISEFDLRPLGGVVLRDEDVVLAVFFDQRALWDHDRVGLGIRADLDANERAGPEARLRLDGNGDFHGAARLIDDRADSFDSTLQARGVVAAEANRRRLAGTYRSRIASRKDEHPQTTERMRPRLNRLSIGFSRWPMLTVRVVTKPENGARTSVRDRSSLLWAISASSSPTLCWNSFVSETAPRSSCCQFFELVPVSCDFFVADQPFFARFLIPLELGLGVADLRQRLLLADARLLHLQLRLRQFLLRQAVA